jgi:hypothetical protein
MEAIDGHFSLAHAPFGDRNAIMQENITIGEWLDTQRHIMTVSHQLQTTEPTPMTECGKPNDGTYICTLEALARLFNTDCDNAGFILTLFLCLLIIISISAASFIFWKRKYDQKLEASTQILKNLGINLFDTTVPGNTLDKWEVPKDQVVINRRLGDGAFGTVYGGEARMNENWTAVAVDSENRFYDRRSVRLFG